MNLPLSERAKEIYRSYVELLGAEPSRHQLEMLQAFATEKARWLDAQEYLAKNGTTILIRSDKGDVKAVQEAPEVKIAERARVAYLDLSMRLGFGEKHGAEEYNKTKRQGRGKAR